MNGIYLKNKIDDIKMRLMSGVIEYEQAKKEAEPIIEQMNENGLEVAKKFNKRFCKFTFSKLMR